MRAINPKYARVVETIGEVCILWAHLESRLRQLTLHLAQAVSPSYANATLPFEIVTSHMDIRGLVQSAKVLIHEFDSGTYYKQACAILDPIDNELRTERNRFVHDGWTLATDKIVRTKPGAKINKAQAGKTEMVRATIREFDSADEVENLTSRIVSTIKSVRALDMSVRIKAQLL